MLAKVPNIPDRKKSGLPEHGHGSSVSVSLNNNVRVALAGLVLVHVKVGTESASGFLQGRGTGCGSRL